MTYPIRHHAAATRPQPRDAADFDALLPDDEFDDELDRQLAAYREALADCRHF